MLIKYDEDMARFNCVLRCLATAKSALTSFSPSPSHLLVRLLELMFIRLLLASAASARASKVFPLP